MINIEVNDKFSLIRRGGSSSRPLELLQVSVTLAVVALVCVLLSDLMGLIDCDSNSLFFDALTGD